MRWLVIWWHMWLNYLDEEEVRQQSIAGTASDAWTANVMQRVLWRLDRIDSLRLTKQVSGDAGRRLSPPPSLNSGLLSSRTPSFL
jgi:hypothetical protein